MKKKILLDSSLNIVASAIPIIVLQLIILPIIGSRLGDIRYGLVITLISMATLFSQPIGSVLNNVRLLSDHEYKERESLGDFNVLLIIGLIINFVVVLIGTTYYVGLFSFLEVSYMVLFSSLNLLRIYLSVSFRIILNYKSILIDNLILVLGYLLGLCMFLLFGHWQLIYLCGSLLSLLYIIRKTTLLSEPIRRTALFRHTASKSIILLLSGLITSAMMYADKLLLFPLLGPASVSIYYSATLMGKIISMAITPISGVMLSYLAKMKSMKLRIFLQILMIASGVAIVGYFIVLFISPILLKLLYPQWANESLKLIYITTATTMVGVLESVIHPIILRFKHMNWQLIINAFSLTTYLAFVFLFYSLFGLIGFSIGILISHVLTLLLKILIYVQGFKKRVIVSV